MKIKTVIEQSGCNEKQLAAMLWPDSAPVTQYQNLRLLKLGKHKNISIEKIRMICDFCGCTPNDII